MGRARRGGGLPDVAWSVANGGWERPGLRRETIEEQNRGVRPRYGCMGPGVCCRGAGFAAGPDPSAGCGSVGCVIAGGCAHTDHTWRALSARDRWCFVLCVS